VYEQLGLKKEIAKPGTKFENTRLTLLETYSKNIGSQNVTVGKFQCDCGNTKEYVLAKVKGRIVSCGCWKAEKASERMSKMNADGLGTHPTHGMSRSRLYKIYHGMLNRCYREKDINYKHYGGRGITVCNEWRDSFEKFAEWALSHGYDDKLTIERKKVDGNYCPENCEFATKKKQANNTRRNHIINAFGEQKTLALWTEDQRCVVDYNTLKYRVHYYGWDAERAITTPSMRKS
jgi:hypothetical protein